MIGFERGQDINFLKLRDEKLAQIDEELRKVWGFAMNYRWKIKLTNSDDIFCIVSLIFLSLRFDKLNQNTNNNKKFGKNSVIVTFFKSILNL